MINELLVCSQKVAENFTPDDSWGVISIRGGRTKVNLQSGWGDRLEVVFNDITRPIPGFVHFDHKHASTIINWLDYHYVRGVLDKLAIHCEQGVSRSQAVGLFINQYYAKHLPASKNASRYNKHVFQTLATAHAYSMLAGN